MALGDFNKKQFKDAEEALVDLFNGLPKSRKGEYIGHLNEIGLMLSAAKRVAPEEGEKMFPDLLIDLVENHVDRLDEARSERQPLKDWLDKAKKFA